jgi:outer membrane lipase/esterase
MTGNTSRRAFLALACAPAALLAACGSSTIESALKPTRLLSVGDSFSDLGQGSSRKRYTVNDDSVNIWTGQVAANYGLPLVAKVSGGWSYAQGGARVSSADTTDGVPSIEAQITSLLADTTFGANDVVLVNAGLDEVVAQVTALGISSQTTANVKAAGTALGTQVKRLVAAGAKYVVVAGLHNLGHSPWAVTLTQTAALTTLSNQFNEAFLISTVDLGAYMLYVDMPYYLNLVYNSPSTYSLSNVTSQACTTTDTTACTTSTITSGLDIATTMFADGVHLTPIVNRLVGDYAYTKLTGRW